MTTLTEDLKIRLTMTPMLVTIAIQILTKHTQCKGLDKSVKDWLSHWILTTYKVNDYCLKITNKSLLYSESNNKCLRSRKTTINHYVECKFNFCGHCSYMNDIFFKDEKEQKDLD